MELLSETEYAVMEIFWENGEPITNQEVQEEYLRRNPDGIKTVHNITSRLLKKGYIKEDVVVKIKKRFAQKFAVAVSAVEYLQLQLMQNYAFKKEPDTVATALFAHLVKDEIISKEAIEQMKEILSET